MGKIKKKWNEIISSVSMDIGVDLGTSNTVILVKDRGIVVEEPTMLVRLKRKRWTGLGAPKMAGLQIMAYGQKAKDMLNREPRHLEVVAPMKNGIISDLETVETMLAYYLRLVNQIPTRYPMFFKPRVVVGVPSSVTDVEKRAVRAIFLASGAREVVLVEEAVLAAVGLGLPTGTSAGLLVVDVGGGKIEATVVSLGGVVVGKGLKIGAADWDTAIVNFIKMKYGLLIGPNTAERLKIELGNLEATKREGRELRVVRGRDLETGLPRSIKLDESEVNEALLLNIQKVVKLVKEVLDETPPELMDDILRRGIVLIGRGAQIKGLARMLEAETKISVRLAEEPGYCVIRGCGMLLDDRELLAKIKLVSGRR